MYQSDLVFFAFIITPVAALVVAIHVVNILKASTIIPSSEGSQFSDSGSNLVKSKPDKSTSKFVIKERPLLMWGIIVFMQIIIIGQINSLFILGFPNSEMGLILMLSYLRTVLVLPELIYKIQFFNLKKNSLKWLYISLVPVIVLDIVSFQLIGAAVIAGLGWITLNYISNKKVNNQPVIN